MSALRSLITSLRPAADGCAPFTRRIFSVAFEHARPRVGHRPAGPAHISSRVRAHGTWRWSLLLPPLRPCCDLPNISPSLHLRFPRHDGVATVQVLDDIDPYAWAFVGRWSLAALGCRSWNPVTHTHGSSHHPPAVRAPRTPLQEPHQRYLLRRRCHLRRHRSRSSLQTKIERPDIDARPRPFRAARPAGFVCLSRSLRTGREPRVRSVRRHLRTGCAACRTRKISLFVKILVIEIFASALGACEAV